jgi:hypothetical protein
MVCFGAGSSLSILVMLKQVQHDDAMHVALR